MKNRNVRLRKRLFIMIFILMGFIFQADLRIDPANKLAMLGFLLSIFFAFWNIVALLWSHANRLRKDIPKNPGEFSIRRNVTQSKR
jgi:hypothetical protein